MSDPEAQAAQQVTRSRTLITRMTQLSEGRRGRRKQRRRTGNGDRMPSLVNKPTLQVVTPWVVTGGSDGKIDYDKLIEKV